MSIHKGIVIVDKPSGLTSGEVVRRAQEILGVKKAGHTGTLDTKASGVLIVALGEAVKAMPLFVGFNKTYRVVMSLHKTLPRKSIEKTCRNFVGKIKQIPPIKSNVSRKEREREIYSFNILKVDGRDVTFDVRCQAGTYIRKLVHDIGQALGSGAHMSYLRRVAVDGFFEKDCVKLEKLKPTDMIKLEDFLEKIQVKKVVVRNSFLADVKNGKPITANWIVDMDKKIEKGDVICVFDYGGELVALGETVRSYLEYSIDITRKDHGYVYVKIRRVLN